MLVALPVLYLFFSKTVYNAVFCTKVYRNFFEICNERYPDSVIIDGKILKVKNVKIKSFDNLKLNGYIIENKSAYKKWVILSHGYLSNAESLSDISKSFFNLGFNILLIDHRGHGGSEGNYTSLGCKEYIDIKDWVSFLVKEYQDSEICLWGISMGATSVLLSCGENLPKNVKLCIADCGFDCLYDELKYIFEYRMGINPVISNFILFGMSIIARMKYNIDIRSSVVSILKKSNIPILFIHGRNDTFVPLNNSIKMYKNYNGQKFLVVINNAKHCMANVTDCDKYWGNVKIFVNKYMNN